MQFLYTMASKDIPHSPRASDSASAQRESASATSSTEPSQPQAVRFASVNQEIEPAYSIQSLSTLRSQDSSSNLQFSPEAQEEIRNLSRSIQSSQLQQRRMTHFAFEPVSLPTSRVSQVCYKLGSEASILLSIFVLNGKCWIGMQFRTAICFCFDHSRKVLSVLLFVSC